MLPCPVRPLSSKRPHVPDALSDRVRNEAGDSDDRRRRNSEADHVNSIIAAGRADLCAIARPHLANPAWTLNEAARIGYFDVAWPKPYTAAKSQLERNLERERAQAAAKQVCRARTRATRRGNVVSHSIRPTPRLRDNTRS